MSLEHCTPSDIPQEISQYDGDVAQMNVGKSGKIGYLQLELQNDSDKQKTIITKNELRFHYMCKRHYIMIWITLLWLMCLFYLLQVEFYKEIVIGWMLS